MSDHKITTISMTRAVQSVLHKRIHDRALANQLGCGIADFIVANWGTIEQEFGSEAADELDIAEHIARIVLRELAA